MCGIAGVLSAAPIERSFVESMRDSLAHRGPDHAGIWCSETSDVCFGHRRLAIVDLSPDANQPFVSSDGRFVVTFNGEIYNFRHVRAELSARGVRFRTKSDTEVLVEAFRYWGDRCPVYLSGMFAFAIWDTRDRRLFCARDRAGEKPFYYATCGDSFVFGSELKALVTWPGLGRRINYPALIDYLSFGYIPDPKSIWEGCYKLPPGHAMSVQFDSGGVPTAREPIAYWDFALSPDYSVADWGPIIRDAVMASSAEMAFADVPVGAFLSGGIDSSSVTAALTRGGCSVNTFTVGFNEPAYDERPWAQAVASRYRTNHAERVVNADDVASVFETLVWHFDEPFNDYSYLPTYYVCREARRLITVALSGDGGDEMFAGYTKYRRLGLRRDVQRFVPDTLSQILFATGTRLLPARSQSREVLLRYQMDASAMLTDMLNTGFSLPALKAAARGPLAETLKQYAPVDVVSPLLEKAAPERVGLINSMRYLDLKLTLGSGILTKVDRASMAVSLEVRPVFLHRDVMNLAGRIPPERLADRAHTKRALKDAMRPWLPQSTLQRRKAGFAMPLTDWLTGDLGDFFAQDRGRHLLRELVDETALIGMDGAAASGGGGVASSVHSLFFLRHWLTTWT